MGADTLGLVSVVITPAPLRVAFTRATTVPQVMAANQGRVLATEEIYERVAALAWPDSVPEPRETATRSTAS